LHCVANLKFHQVKKFHPRYLVHWLIAIYNWNWY
jgi:hypothetical protein